MHVPVVAGVVFLGVENLLVVRMAVELASRVVEAF